MIHRLLARLRGCPHPLREGRWVALSMDQLAMKCGRCGRLFR